MSLYETWCTLAFQHPYLVPPNKMSHHKMAAIEVKRFQIKFPITAELMFLSQKLHIRKYVESKSKSTQLAI
jgi:hypothetical protein